MIEEWFIHENVSYLSMCSNGLFVNERLIKMQCFARNAPKWLQINSKCFRSHFEIVFERNGGCKILR